MREFVKETGITETQSNDDAFILERWDYLIKMSHSWISIKDIDDQIRGENRMTLHTQRKKKQQQQQSAQVPEVGQPNDTFGAKMRWHKIHFHHDDDTMSKKKKSL